MIRRWVPKLWEIEVGTYGAESDHCPVIRKILARPEGLEPSTPGLEGRCSIQLSYGRVRFMLLDRPNQSVWNAGIQAASIA